MDPQSTPVATQTIPLQQEFCPKCKSPVTPDENFCPHCGNKLVRHVSLIRQIWIYFVSLALPPLGLVWTFRFFRSQYRQVRWVGIVAALLTAISIIVTVWVSVGFINTVNQQVQQQLNSYPSVGF